MGEVLRHRVEAMIINCYSRDNLASCEVSSKPEIGMLLVQMLLFYSTDLPTISSEAAAFGSNFKLQRSYHNKSACRLREHVSTNAGLPRLDCSARSKQAKQDDKYESVSTSYGRALLTT